MKQFASFRLDSANECLWRDGVQIPLPPRPYAVLRYLVENPGRLITHDELLDALWPETFVQPQVLRTYVLELRKLLGDDPAHPRFIQTLPKRGYCFVAAVCDCGAGDRGAGVGSAATGVEFDKGPGVASGIGNSNRAVVGRDDELARLQSLVLGMASGVRRVVFLSGEAGIGKTALVDTFCRQLSAPVTVARGQCVEGFGSKEEYYPLMEALSQLCATQDGETACRVLAQMAPAWLAALRRTPGIDPPMPPATMNQERTPGDLCAAFERMAEQKPLILVFEDVHWADDSTLNLISALARRRAPARLMVLATCGPGIEPAGASGEHPLRRLKQNLLMRQLCTEMALTPLTRTAVSQLLARELGQEMLPAGLTGFVHQHSEGNPLFAIAILEHLIARRFLIREGTDGGERWVPVGGFREMEAEVPERLAQMIELEIEGLSEEEQRVLGAGSVMGIAFPAWAVAAALEEDAARVEEACSGLARRLHFVEHGGQDELPGGLRSDFYVFVHGLYREVLYRRQSATRRAGWHARIAQRLGEIFAGREATVAREMAMHFEAAGEWTQAIGAMRTGAQHAHEHQAHNEATQLLEDALRLAEKLSGGEREARLRDIRDDRMNYQSGNGEARRLRIVAGKV